jgi:hypothetical protein
MTEVRAEKSHKSVEITLGHGFDNKPLIIREKEK